VSNGGRPEEVEEFLAELRARGRSERTERSYALDSRAAEPGQATCSGWPRATGLAGDGPNGLADDRFLFRPTRSKVEQSTDIELRR
jgi:hypothetical protein